GENGHLAFNDPHVADFNDPYTVKKVLLDLECRQQQVNDGCFAELEDVPESALTLTIPTLMNAEYIFCMVPGENKAQAVYNTLNQEINEEFPASAIRNHRNAILFLDLESASRL